MWGGEFGRPGLTPDNGKDETGHNPRGFTFWMAGGGVRAGHVHGKTDPTSGAARSRGRCTSAISMPPFCTCSVYPLMNSRIGTKAATTV